MLKNRLSNMPKYVLSELPKQYITEIGFSLKYFNN